MSEVNDALENDMVASEQATCFWTRDYCWHLELEDCEGCPEKEVTDEQD